ncbi:hypothetical protein [Labrenzia sp. 011]|uniref:hypothetical protein n=1 Tax=Labrenzia sp. 011 TaxID=2171494 RepID=UPI00105731F3|nr:hypothetical protein [Labrenzia sp. 011]
MQTPDNEDRSNRTSSASFAPALLYMLAAGPLLLMAFALEPTLAPPLAAFLAMTALTFRMGQRLYGELVRAASRRN